MKRLFTLATITCIAMHAEASFGRTITGFHLAQVSAVTPVSTPSPNNNNTVNASPNAIALPASGSPATPFLATTLDPIDFVFDVQTSGATTEYRVTSYVANNTGTPWTGFIFQLGSGLGANFKIDQITIPEVVSPNFDGPNFDPDMTNSAFSTIALNVRQITFSGGTLSSGPSSVMTSAISIDTPDDISGNGGYTNFTLRMIPVPEPCAVLLGFIGGMGIRMLRKRDG